MGTLSNPETAWLSANSPGLAAPSAKIVAMLDTLTRGGIAFIAIKEQIRIEGQTGYPDQGDDDALCPCSPRSSGT